MSDTPPTLTGTTSTGYMPLDNQAPAWLRDISRFLAIRPQFVLNGNINDYVLMPAQGNMAVPVTLKDAVNSLLEVCGYEYLLCYDPFDFFQIYAPSPEKNSRLKTALGMNFDSNGHVDLSSNKLLEIMRKFVTLASPRGGLLIEYAARFEESGQNQLYGHSLKLSHTAVQLPMPDGHARFNPIFWVVNNTNQMPDWFVNGNERIRVQTIQRPEVGIRERAMEIRLKGVPGYKEASEQKKRETIEAFARSTEGFTLSGLVSTVTLARDQGYSFENILDAVQLYKLGVTDNPWKQNKLHELIGGATAEIEKQVKGQQQAIFKTVDTLMRSVTCLSGAQASPEPISGRPRGVLFFAGPTGVGKTELAKAISKLLFGSTDAYLRFDMSEFAQEHTEARLIGSPPGYIGHFEGGELTRAIQEKPFSVVLFDEIEKAHPRILDKFLQILEDGRLTDGQGVTAYFSEAIIVFTSNLGIYKDSSIGERVENVTPSMEYPEIITRITSAIEDYFKYKLLRPEILNRLGDNIVVFNFITKDVAKQILKKQLNNVKIRVLKEHSLNIEIASNVEEILEEMCTSQETLANGGRGIGNRLETLFVNPLARALFSSTTQKPVQENPTVVQVTDIKIINGVQTVLLG